ncbi:MAG: ATP-binding protein [Ignavibacteria bacterium]|nr:ATP-binding protein [Ignavibacteria bacterium]
MERKKGSILLVEDEKIVALDIRKNLELLGFNVVAVVASGEAAIGKADQYLPDVIIMDIYLKGEMDGIQTSEIINKTHDIPIIFLTASSDERNIQRAKSVAPYGYLIKPFDLTDLRITLEITLAKAETEKKVKESERLLYATLKNINDAVIVTHPDNTIRFMNQRAEKLTGWERNEVLGKELGSVLNVLDDLDNEGLIYILSSAIPERLHEIRNLKLLLTKSALPLPIEIHTNSLVDEYGRVTGFIYSFHDITLQREIEKALISSRNFYLTLFEDFPAMIWRTNENGQFNYFNQTWLRFTGRSIANEADKGWYDNIHPDDRYDFAENIRLAHVNQNKFELEFRMKNSIGEFRYVSCIASPYFTSRQGFSGCIGVCYDTTERKNLELYLERAKNLAEAAAKAKSTFLANMSHEIRTPINGIIGTIEVLMESKLDTEQHQFVYMAKRSAISLLNLLNNVLEYSKLESGKYSVQKLRVSVKEILQDSFVLFEPEANLKGLQLKFTVPENLDEDIFTDPIRISQVLNNLIGNAIKFTKRGSISIGVEKQVDEDKTAIFHFYVADTGIGINPELQAKVFDSFTQGDSTSTKKYPGAGLGLTICRQIVELMGGKIWFTSEVNKGTTFYFTIPETSEAEIEHVRLV